MDPLYFHPTDGSLRYIKPPRYPDGNQHRKDFQEGKISHQEAEARQKADQVVWDNYVNNYLSKRIDGHPIDGYNIHPEAINIFKTGKEYHIEGLQIEEGIVTGLKLIEKQEVKEETEIPEEQQTEQYRTTMGKKRMLEALTEKKGIVSAAATLAGISRNTHYAWYNNDPEYRENVDGIAEVALDFVEEKLFKNIDEGDTTAQIFYLKTKGKKRGYIERQEIDTSGTMHLTWHEEKTYVDPAERKA